MAQALRIVRWIAVTLALLAILGLSIATLVTVLNIQSNEGSSATTKTIPKNITIPTLPTQTTSKSTAKPQTTATTKTPAPTVTVTEPPKNDNPLNIPKDQQISSNDDRYSAYQDIVTLLKTGLDTSVSPCDDFYQYKCGNWGNAEIGFDTTDFASYRAIEAQLTNIAYVNKAPQPVQQLAHYFDECKNARSNWDVVIAGGQVAIDAIAKLGAGENDLEGKIMNDTVFPFPMWDGGHVNSFPTPRGLGYLVGYATGAFDVETLVAPWVDTNWKDPHGKNGYAFIVDQPTTFFPNSYYRKAWNTTRPFLIKSIVSTMNNLATAQNRKLNQVQLNIDATAIADLDYTLAIEFSSDDISRRMQRTRRRTRRTRNYNPYTISDLSAKYTQIDWNVLVQEAAQASTPATNTLLSSTDPFRYYTVMEEDYLSKLLNALNDDNKFGITPRALVNYIYARVVKQYKDYIPAAPGSSLETAFELEVNQKSRFGVRGRNSKMAVGADENDIPMQCIQEGVWSFSYASTRAYIDRIYPDQISKFAIHAKMGQLSSNIIEGFRSMLDELNWMSDGSKAGAYDKIDNLVKNIAYPDWVLDNEKLTVYYLNLDINQKTSYLDIVDRLKTFNIKTSWDFIASGPADREEFSGPSATTNAWYQPERNSITFPAAILNKPFYDPQWPASMNFGGLGVIIGHELTHGFDDDGINWDGTGILYTWMDDTSSTGFSNMAKCVIDQYNGFCPLNNSFAAPCLDGAQTQSENIADNGGIHAAYRAYRNYIDLNGPDPLLPDEILSGFTSDQLFFLNFAQVWCEPPPLGAVEELQILVDVHSPSKYRVFGSLQNFPAFKSAFHCPTSAYAPDEHCDVWVSDVTPSFGLPNPKNDLNTLENKPITTDDLDKYNAYTDAVNYYKYSVDTSADPCDDYWKYACGNYNKSSSFDFADDNNNVRFAQQLTDPEYQATIRSSSALTKEKQFFDSCVNFYQNALVSKNFVKDKMDSLAHFLGSDFILLTGEDATLPNPQQLAQGLGYLSFSEGTDTFVTPMVDTYWKDPTKGYQFFIDQNTAFYSKSYYPDKAFGQIRQKYIDAATSVIATYAKEQNLPVPVDLSQRVADLVDFEQTIANTFSTDDNTRRQYERSWNLQKASDMTTKYPFIDWASYLGMAPNVSTTVLGDLNYQVSVMEVAQTDAMSKAYLEGSNGFSAENVVNYLNMRLLLTSSIYLPEYASAVAGLYEEPNSFLSRKPRGRRTPKRKSSHPKSDTLADIQVSCASQANGLMQYANGRVFIDNLYPSTADQNAIRTSAGGIITNIVTSFQGMLDQLDWMDDQTKKPALQKTVDIQKNIAFPDWIMVNPLLDAYYANLEFAADDDYFTMFDKLNKYNIMLQYKYLTMTAYDRTDFLGPPGTVNAWYQPELNSITFPAGILQQPYFDSNWPASINYGGMGIVAGHELTHGFDDEGVQWDSIGTLSNWMSADSSKSFNAMAQCVIDEYDGFCPLDNNTYYPNCVNGEQTQGENIADNGGIHAAFNAYRTHIALDGPDPLLPDHLFGQMNHDQLFFLNYAQVWCEAGRTDDKLYTQLMVDPHSPSQYRVFGAIQNFPAFRVAYNCPVGSAYAPKDYCKVWVPNWMA